MKHELQFKSFGIESKKEDNSGNLIIEGYGAVFGNIDAYGDVINPGAFSKTIAERADRIAFCYQHDIWNPIGKIQSLKEDSKGLFISVMISEAEKDIQTKVKEGILKEMSIGYRNINSNQGMVDGVEVMYLNEIMLYEISLVTIAANPMATITAMKSDEQRNFLNEEVERLIAIERNQQKKYDLMKLKSYITALELKEPGKPDENEPTPKTEPLITKEEIFKILKVN